MLTLPNGRGRICTSFVKGKGGGGINGINGGGGKLIFTIGELGGSRRIGDGALNCSSAKLFPNGKNMKKIQ